MSITSKQVVPVLLIINIVLALLCVLSSLGVIALSPVYPAAGITITTLASFITHFSANQNSGLISYTDTAVVTAQESGDASEKVIDDNTIEGQLELKLRSHLLTAYEKDNKSADITEILLRILCSDLDLCQGLIYTRESANEFVIKSTYAYIGDLEKKIIVGEGISGQVIKNGQYVYLKDVPKGYLKVVSGLGESSPTVLLIIPTKINDKVEGLVELASFKELGGKSNIQAIVSSVGYIMELTNKTKK